MTDQQHKDQQPKMDYIKSNYNIISTALFVLAIVVAHIFSTNNYDWTKNTISELGSQGYDRKLIMQFGFLAFGLTLSAGILANDLTWRTTPILIYGLCVGLTGIFCTNHSLLLTIIQHTGNNSFCFGSNCRSGFYSWHFTTTILLG
jgi:hypothetical membrane protein